MAAIVDDKIFCCHGGLSPDLHDFEQIKEIARPTDVPDTGVVLGACLVVWRIRTCEWDLQAVSIGACC